MRSFVHILIYLVVLGCQLVLVLISIHVQILSLLVWEYKEKMDLKQNLLVPYWTSLSTRQQRAQLCSFSLFHLYAWFTSASP